MGKLTNAPWHWWLNMVVLILGLTLFVLNFALGWDQKWIALGAPVITLASSAYSFRLLWTKSDPARARGERQEQA
ncbi:hypothetical protein HD599_000024 [Conyzicola lurida]|uniref:Uncharacterized protein n=1 Tax=Conyzicola lurida TaxID=1172621 RepID=A0A841AJ25_9MICO|nr:hypothetical protein [Conyzicola lurida]MBB5841701.1 hypothetical protein [Conyzicola lurida]